MAIPAHVVETRTPQREDRLGDMLRQFSTSYRRVEEAMNAQNTAGAVKEFKETVGYLASAEKEMYHALGTPSMRDISQRISSARGQMAGLVAKLDQHNILVEKTTPSNYFSSEMSKVGSGVLVLHSRNYQQ